VDRDGNIFGSNGSSSYSMSESSSSSLPSSCSELSLLWWSGVSSFAVFFLVVVVVVVVVVVEEEEEEEEEEEDGEDEELSFVWTTSSLSTLPLRARFLVFPVDDFAGLPRLAAGMVKELKFIMKMGLEDTV
jgi:hypothetical protein